MLTERAQLRDHNSLRLPSVAQRLFVLREAADLPRLIDLADGDPAGVKWLAGGSNVVLRRSVPGTVCLVRLRGVHLSRGPRAARLRVAAGESWHGLVRFCLARRVAGLENLAFIPGTVGAAPIQNIGAYGSELAQYVAAVHTVDLVDGRSRVFDAGACGFGYRTSVFRGQTRYLIVAVELELPHASTINTTYRDVDTALRGLRGQPDPAGIARIVTRIRRAKLPDPRTDPNVGSFFKNPCVDVSQADWIRSRHPQLPWHENGDGAIKFPAAALIDACGWKGRIVRGVEVWRRQPLVLVNRGGVDGAAVLSVAAEIANSVGERFGVSLELEPQVLGVD